MHRLYLLAFIAACSATSHDQPDAAIDTPPDSNVVTVVLTNMPLFVAYRDGNGPWLTPDAGPRNTYVLHVTGAYRFLWVCSYPSGGFDAELELATIDDGTRAHLYCASPDQTPTVAVTGQMTQAGSVSMTAFASSVTAPWSFHLDVAPGSHDLVATSSDHVLIRRDVSIAGAQTLPTVDVAASGTALDVVPLTITGLDAGDTLGTSVDLSTTNDFNQVWTGTTSTVRALPASLIHAGDHQVFSVDATTPTSYRSGVSMFTGTETTFALLPRLTGVMFGPINGELGATWSNLPMYSELDFYLDDFSSAAAVSTQHVDATKRWLDATGATSLAFDPSAPGYRVEWNIDPAGRHASAFAATRLDGTTGYFSTETFEVPGQ